MKSSGKRLTLLICVFSLLANLVFGAMAQEKKDSQKVDNLVAGIALTDSIYITTLDPAGSDGIKSVLVGGGAFQFSSQELGFNNRLVPNAPFTIDISFETIQSLPDGTRITQSFEGRSYRDNQGRTRSERSYTLGSGGEWTPIISIHDPVEG